MRRTADRRNAIACARSSRVDLRYRLRRTRACASTSSCLASTAAAWRGDRWRWAPPGAILHYLRDTQRSALDHLDRPAYYDRSDAMMLDAVTVRNLELIEPLFAGESKESTLVHVLDQTCTGMGGRLLRSRLLRPSHRRCGDRGAAGCGCAAGRGDDRARRSCARRLGRFSIWSDCSPKSRSGRRVRAMCWRSAGRSR